MTFTRNDVAIAVTSDGTLYAAQGRPARNNLPNDLVSRESGLYYSQLRYRVAYKTPSGEYRVGTATEAKTAKAISISRFWPVGKMTGSAARVGRV